ncbi:MAG: TolC family protein [PVC group bacterium]
MRAGHITLMVLFTLLPAVPGGVNGQPDGSAGPYSLDNCLDLAYAKNPIILRALQEIKAAGGRKLQALSEAIPHLSGEAGYTYLDRIQTYETEMGDLPLNLHDNYNAGVTIEQNLYKGGQILAGIKAAALYNEYAEAYFQEALIEVTYRVKENFYLIVLQEGIVRVRRDTVAHMEDYLEITRKRYDQGTTSEFDLITARVRLANSRPPLIQAENRVDILKTSLSREMGIPAGDFNITGELSYQPFQAGLDDLNRLGREHRPLLKEVLLQEQLQEQNLRASRSGYQPSLSVFATYQGEQPQSGLPPEDRFEFEWLAGAALKWSLFDGLMTPGKVQEANARYHQAKIDTEDATRTVLLGIKQAYLDIRAAQKAFESQRETVEQAEAAYRIARIRWENGISTSLELTDAELNLSEARLMLQEALAAHWISLAKLEQTMGMPLPEIRADVKTESKTES